MMVEGLLNDTSTAASYDIKGIMVGMPSTVHHCVHAQAPGSLLARHTSDTVNSMATHIAHHLEPCARSSKQVGTAKKYSPEWRKLCDEQVIRGRTRKQTTWAS